MEIKYAIIDGAVEEGLLDFLKEVNPPHCCLYAEPIQSDLVALAPYLVEVTENVNRWLNEKVTPWGIYFTSDLSLRELQQHFRHYLWVMIPEQEKPVLMRFYDPRNIWVLAEVLTPRQLFSFIWPIGQLSTYYREEHHENSFISVKSSEMMNVFMDPCSLLTLTYRQYNQLERKARDNYLEVLSVFIKENAEKGMLSISSEDQSLRSLAEEYFSFCQSLNIADERSIRAMTLILLNKNITDTRYIPDSWHELLNNQSYAGHNRVHKLALQELGFIPQ
ncbi:DUF4123 domain-containing protein [Salmonella enterica]|nr:DUF4123 domain-containing protein [Salmonella enterica]ECJ9256538.1 DUF4123 domain-containing protein [Salmonella enterica]EDN6829138.1 DUF4123 domain-containing protein [Salmonella enterica]EGA5141951.1 DUF4123 domain-containing protein [Salmonella enterica]EHO5151145.1 DUF4123 domain-containing protein [Salmonella enterica]